MHKIKTIDYEKLAHARKFYEAWGFDYMETPWLVSEEADSVTRPVNVSGLKTDMGNLVASGEQSFIQLMLEEELKLGCYQTLTPCFREEPVYDDIHQPWFMKLELIDNKDVTSDRLEEIVLIAHQFFNMYISAEIIQLGPTDFDIITKPGEVELGSYNIKAYRKFRWICGTGIAEPRLSSQI